MDFRRIKGATRTLAEDQPEYETLAVRDTLQRYDFGGATGVQVVPFVTFEVRPDADELAKLNAGESVFVTLMGRHTPFPPVSVCVGDPLDWPADDTAE